MKSVMIAILVIAALSIVSMAMSCSLEPNYSAITTDVHVWAVSESESSGEYKVHTSRLIGFGTDHFDDEIALEFSGVTSKCEAIKEAAIESGYKVMRPEVNLNVIIHAGGCE